MSCLRDTWHRCHVWANLWPRSRCVDEWRTRKRSFVLLGPTRQILRLLRQLLPIGRSALADRCLYVRARRAGRQLHHWHRRSKQVHHFICCVFSSIFFKLKIIVFFQNKRETGVCASVWSPKADGFHLGRHFHWCSPLEASYRTSRSYGARRVKKYVVLFTCLLGRVM